MGSIAIIINNKDDHFKYEIDSENSTTSTSAVQDAVTKYIESVLIPKGIFSASTQFWTGYYTDDESEQMNKISIGYIINHFDKWFTGGSVNVPANPYNDKEELKKLYIKIANGFIRKTSYEIKEIIFSSENNSINSELIPEPDL
jgi:hypothetical protein